MLEVLSYLKCPVCSGALAVGAVEETHGNKLWNGGLTCEGCKATRRVREGVLEFDVQAEGREDATIKAFGKEWTHYKEHGEFFQSVALFNRFSPGVPVEKLDGKNVIEIGCGGGRWLKLVGEHVRPNVVFGLEPSEAAYVAALRTRDVPNVYVVRGSVYGMAFQSAFDVAFSLGVISFVKDMKLACEEVANILKPNGEFSYWLYAYEGNELYLKLFPVIQAIALRLPDPQIRWVAKSLSGLVLLHARTIHRALARVGIYPPMGRYLEMYRKLTWRDAESVIYDQLVPNITRYLRRDEVLATIPASLALKELYMPSGNSWSVLAVKV